MKTILLSLIFILCIPFQIAAAGQTDPAFSRSMLDNLYKNRNNFALLYFVQPGCVYCQRQQPVMAQFQQATNWYIKTIDIIENPEVRSKFNVSGTPVIVMITRNGSASNWQTVSIGYSPINTLSEDVNKLVRIFNGHEPDAPYYVRSQNNSSTPIR